MMTLVFLILMVWIFGKMVGFAVKATWGLTKILLNLVLLPLTLLGLLIGGLVQIAFPILIIAGIVMLVREA